MVLSLALAASAHAAIGDLDPSFGAPNGFVFTGQMGSNLGGGRVLVDPSGRIVVSGGVNGAQAFLMVRYLPSGALDHDFNGSGMNTQSLNGATESVAITMLREPGGQLLLGGYAGSGDRQFMLARFTDAGALDSTFNPAGNPPGTEQLDLIGSTDERVTGLGLLSSGKIAAVGSDQAGALEYFRRTDTGASDLDPVADTFTGVTSISPTGMVVEPGDKVLVGGYAMVAGHREFFVARLLSDGTPDSTFGTGGITTFNVGDPAGDDEGNAIALQPDGRAVIAGTADETLTTRRMAVARVTSSGALDPTFGSGGATLIAPAPNKSVGTGVALQPNGKVLVSGDANVIGEGTGDFTLIRLNANGAPDPTFGSGGVAVHSLVSGGDVAQGMALQPDGNAVLAGSAFGGTSAQIAVARFLGGELPPAQPLPAAPDKTKPRISKLKLLTKKLGKTLKLRLHLSEAGKVTIKVSQKKHKLATKTVRFTKPATKTIKIKLSHRSRVRLAKLHRPAIKLTLTATDLSGNRSKRTLSAKLRHG